MNISFSMNTTTALRAMNALASLVESPYVAMSTADRSDLFALLEHLEISRRDFLHRNESAPAMPSQAWSLEAHDRWVARYRAAHAKKEHASRYYHAAEV